MADSDNTTTLSSVTRRTDRDDAPRLGNEWASVDPAADGQSINDPALGLSLAWIEVHTTTLASCILQQEAEAELIKDGEFSSIPAENAGR